MALRTDYKDDMFEGQRRYNIVQNQDGTVTLVDMTVYTQKGDQFGANDVNGTNEVVNKAVTRRILTLPAAGWSSAYPFSQTVNVAGIGAEDDIKVIGVYVPENAALDQVKAWNKAAGFLMCSPDGVDAGTVTFKAYKKPAVDFQIITEGA